MANVSDVISQLEKDSDRSDEIENAAKIAEKIRNEYAKEVERIWDIVHPGGCCRE